MGGFRRHRSQSAAQKTIKFRKERSRQELPKLMDVNDKSKDCSLEKGRGSGGSTRLDVQINAIDGVNEINGTSGARGEKGLARSFLRHRKIELR